MTKARLSNAAIRSLLEDISGELAQRDVEVASSPKAKARPARPIVTPPGEPSVTEWFCTLTGLPAPALGTVRQRRAAAALWFAPLREIFSASGSKDRGVEAIVKAVQEMRHRRLTIASPASVLKTAMSELGKMNTRGPAEGSRETYGRF